MTKLTKEQAVSAVQTANTHEAIEAVLMNCTKAMMVEVYEAVSGQKFPRSISGQLKADLADNTASLIMIAREEVAYQAKSVEEKFAALGSETIAVRNNHILLCSMSELKWIAEKLGVWTEGENDVLTVQHKIMKELSVREEVSDIEARLSGNDDVSVKACLCSVMPEALERVIARYGLTVSRDDLPRRLGMAEELYKHYLASKTETGESEPFVSYEDVRRAYNDYYNAQGRYLDSNETDKVEKKIADEAYRKYLTLLAEYRRGAMPEREAVLNWIRERCGEAAWPVERLASYGFDYLVELSHKCGIHAAKFQGISRNDMAVRLIREAGIETCATTFYEFAIKQRKELQAGLHELWQKRHALRKAQRLLGEGSADSEALNDVWEPYQEEVDYLMSKYKEYSRHLQRGRRYEAERRNAA